MRSLSRKQLVLELECVPRRRAVVPRQDALMQALAELLLEALRTTELQASNEGGVDESEDYI